MSYFEELNNINVSEKTEKKNGLTYLSWAWAWAELKKKHPLSTYTIYENKDGMFYHTDGQTCWVKTGVTVVFQDSQHVIEHIEYLPVMDNRNKSIPLDKVTSMDVNTAIQRSLTKAVARHGLGLYIYAGEDLPESAEPVKTEPKPAVKVTREEPEDEVQRRVKSVNALLDEFGFLSSDYKHFSKAMGSQNPREMTVEEFEQHLKALRNYLADIKHKEAS